MRRYTLQWQVSTRFGSTMFLMVLLEFSVETAMKETSTVLRMYTLDFEITYYLTCVLYLCYIVC